MHRSEGTARPRSEFTAPMRGSTATEGWPPPMRLPVRAYRFHPFTGGENIGAHEWGREIRSFPGGMLPVIRRTNQGQDGLTPRRRVPKRPNSRLMGWEW